MKIEDRVRQVLHSRVRSIQQADPPTLDRIEARVSKHYRKRRSAAIGLGAVAGAGAISILLLVVSLPANESNLPTRSAASIERTVSTGGEALALCASESTVWVGLTKADGSYAILRVDAATGQIEGEWKTSFAPGHMAFGGGILWASGIGEDGPGLRALDPTSGDLVSEVAEIRGPIVFGGGYVWATKSGPSAETATIVGIDPRTGQEAMAIVVGSGVHDLAWADGTLFAITTMGGTTRVERMNDEGTLEQIGTNVTPGVLAPGKDGVWIAQEQGGVAQIGYTTGEIRQPTSLPQGTVLPFAENRAGLWAILGGSPGAAVAVLDPVSGEVLGEVALQAGPSRTFPVSAVSTSNASSIWVTTSDGQLLEVAGES
jgi:hypothetical protein